MSHTSDFIIENNILTKYVGPGGDIAIPAGVTEIGILAFFRQRALLQSVTIPDGVRVIGRNAFWDCRNLVAVTIPEGVTTIGEVAFS